MLQYYWFEVQCRQAVSKLEFCSDLVYLGKTQDLVYIRKNSGRIKSIITRYMYKQKRYMWQTAYLDIRDSVWGDFL